jgi:hypothetical protein
MISPLTVATMLRLIQRDMIDSVLSIRGVRRDRTLTPPVKTTRRRTREEEILGRKVGICNDNAFFFVPRNEGFVFICCSCSKSSCMYFTTSTSRRRRRSSKS